MARLISDTYEKRKRDANERFEKLKQNEEELNRIFIDIYGLNDEMSPDVADKDVSVHCIFDSADDVPEGLKGSPYVRTKKDEIKSLISYAVGCMLGRYSVDRDGLAYAGGEWDDSKYKTVKPAESNIIPICPDEFFSDDITERFVDFVKNVYGEETLEQNLAFVADALGGSGTSREVIANYFLKDFYKDHIKTYKKRPIYWLFSSGKKNGFNALVYMHRYSPDLLARMRTDYVHEWQQRYLTRLDELQRNADDASSSGERVRINKSIDDIKSKILEIGSFEEKIHHLADRMTDIDLDDGVLKNYAEFSGVLAKIK